MTLRELADAVGVGEYNPILESTYAGMTFTDDPAVDIGLIDSLEEEWNLFGEFYDLVRTVGIQINGDKERSLWVKVTAKHVIDHPVNDARKVPAPAFDGTVITNMLPFYAQLPSIPLGIAEYLRRGFTREQVTSMMGCYRSSLKIIKRRTGIPGMDKIYYNWDMLFTKARIFKAAGLQFELRTAPKDVVYLKNKQTGQVLPVMNGGTVHRSGIQILGSQGYEDEEGAYQAVFREDPEAFYGYGVFDNRVDKEEKTFCKTQWEAYLRPGDDCLGMHIPRGTDISPEAVNSYIRAAREMMHKHYPEFGKAAIYCGSWILDPMLADITGPQSKITAFLNLFVKYPQKTDGNAVFMFVFDGKPNDLNDLEETTSLHRKLKKLYLEGGCIHPYAGIIIE